MRRFLPFLPPLAVLALYAVWLAFPITIITADIGRHLADGRIFFEFPQWRDALLHTNFYSTSNPEFAIVNHHWGAGLLFSAAQGMLGWTGLHLFAIALCLVALVLILDVTRHLSSGRIACLVALLLLPMLAYRHEVRPEFIAYLLLGTTLWVLHAVCRKHTCAKYLFLLPFLLLLWVNVHASFPMGLALIGLFTVDAFLRKLPIRKTLVVTFILSCLAVLLNPAGLSGALYPFSILQDPGYAVLENQSIPFLGSIGVNVPAFLYLKVTAAVLGLSLGFLAWRKKLASLWPYGAAAVLAVLMGFLAVRHITLAGFLLLPVLAAAALEAKTMLKPRTVLIASVLLAVLSLGHQFTMLRQRWIVLGLEPGANAAAEFMKEQEIGGPLFNNFDIGGYVIYHFFPDVRPFVYNRPESHPSEFWRDVYVPMMQDDAVWKRQLEKNGFKTIILYHGDRTTWAQQFLVARIKDPDWAPVFVDRSVIVFVRRVPEYWRVIQDFEIPASALLR